jgi:TatD DNase family protein
MDIVDSHCHLFLEEFQDKPPMEPGSTLEGVLGRARAAGVSAIVNVALDVDTTLAVLAAHEERPWLHPTAGWHPANAESLTGGDLERLLDLARRPEVVAFGEIGLDYHWRPEAAEVQKRAFRELLKVAASAKKPVIIHCRDAWEDLVGVLAQERAGLAGVLLHCFSGTAAEASRAFELDAHLSFAGPVTFPKAAELRRALSAAPRDRIMIETDAPYLAPAPFRGRRNEPSYLVRHLETVAGVLGIEPAEAAALTSANARRFFGLPGPA